MTEREVTRAIILDDEGKVLLGKRARGMGANQWALIGGKPDPNESLEICIKREVLEELGIEFEPVFYKEELDTATDPEKPWKVYFYTGISQGELNPKPDEISAVVYVSQDDLDRLDIAFDHRERLIEFFEERSKI
jgi:8-oxo-dGTP pyrophosphatase MutT (NUDIX family)